jgi:drug/metabolite transporter (DMT)-like permease
VKKTLVIYVTSLLLFGLNGIVAAAIPLPSSQIVALRTFIGAVFIIGVSMRTTRAVRYKLSHRERVMIVASGICTGLSWVTLYEAYRLAGVGVSSLLYYCAPIAVMIASVPLFGEHFTVQKLIGFIVVVCGTLLVSLQSITVSGDSAGIVLAAISALCHAGMVIFSKMAPNVSGLQSTQIQLEVSCAIAIVFMLLSENAVPLAEIPLDAWPAILLLGLANTGLGCLMYFDSIPKLPAQSVATLGYLEPLSAVVFSAVLLGERMTMLQWFGAAMIIGGALSSEVSIPLLKRRHSNRLGG